MVRHLCDRVAVMYLGRIVECAPTEGLFEHPHHPYTQALLAAGPSLARPRRPGAARLLDEPPSPMAIPIGCRFRTRCTSAIERCTTDDPGITRGDDLGPAHEVCCHVRPVSPVLHTIP